MSARNHRAAEPSRAPPAAVTQDDRRRAPQALEHGNQAPSPQPRRYGVISGHASGRPQTEPHYETACAPAILARRAAPRALKRKAAPGRVARVGFADSRLPVEAGTYSQHPESSSCGDRRRHRRHLRIEGHRRGRRARPRVRPGHHRTRRRVRGRPDSRRAARAPQARSQTRRAAAQVTRPLTKPRPLASVWQSATERVSIDPDGVCLRISGPPARRQATESQVKNGFERSSAASRFEDERIPLMLGDAMPCAGLCPSPRGVECGSFQSTASPCGSWMVATQR